MRLIILTPTDQDIDGTLVSLCLDTCFQRPKSETRLIIFTPTDRDIDGTRVSLSQYLLSETQT